MSLLPSHLDLHTEECIDLCPFELTGEKCRIMHSCEYCSDKPTPGDPMKRQPYVYIFVHRDVLENARDLIEDLTREGIATNGDDYNNEALQALRDLVDPLPEKDIYGHIPHIDHVDLLDERPNT